MAEVEVRRATSEDLPQVAALAGELVRMHRAQDPRRFMLVDDVEGGYRWWFSRELAREEAVLLVAARGAEIAGYAYGTREGRDWNMLLDEHGAIHDIFVAAPARRGGTGAALLNAMIRELEAMGCPRIVLSTMVTNEPAQALFRAHGFRPTMLEMTRGGRSD
jgi:ribosomal protein S18 acetylase RimI-like enzyme